MVHTPVSMQFVFCQDKSKPTVSGMQLMLDGFHAQGNPRGTCGKPSTELRQMRTLAILLYCFLMTWKASLQSVMLADHMKPEWWPSFSLCWMGQHQVQ